MVCPRKIFQKDNPYSLSRFDYFNWDVVNLNPDFFGSQEKEVCCLVVTSSMNSVLLT